VKPQGLQLRYLSALQNIAGERTSTVVFPLPLELLNVFLAPRDRTAGAAGHARDEQLRAVGGNPTAGTGSTGKP
jgi:hypothetical protein